MDLKPQHNIREIARKRGLAVREIDPTAGRVLVASGVAALWMIGQGIFPLRYNPDGSKTFPDHDARASTAYDFYLNYLAVRDERAAQRIEDHQYRRGYTEGWVEAVETIAALMLEEGSSLEEAYSRCIDHYESELKPWVEAE